jgi:hypothetical protein
MAAAAARRRAEFNFFLSCDISLQVRTVHRRETREERWRKRAQLARAATHSPHTRALKPQQSPLTGPGQDLRPQRPAPGPPQPARGRRQQRPWRRSSTRPGGGGVCGRAAGGGRRGARAGDQDDLRRGGGGRLRLERAADAVLEGARRLGCGGREGIRGERFTCQSVLSRTKAACCHIAQPAPSPPHTHTPQTHTLYPPAVPGPAL